MKRAIILILASFLLLIAACSQQNLSAQPSGQTPTIDNAKDYQPSPQAAANSIEITSAGFNPSTLTIKSGETVAWVNMDSAPHWIASAKHPTHNQYPETGGCIGSKFDECKGLKQGESWSFTFNHKGSWGYHDHLNPQPPFFGKIVVE